jgi:predicted Zn-dependent peptidase
MILLPRFTVFILALFGALLFDRSLSAQQTKSDLHRLADGVSELTLDNGLVVLVYPRSNLGPIFSGTVNVRVGGVDEPAGKSGIAHMLEHMAFKGTTELGTANYAAEKVLLAQLEELARMQQVQGNLTPAQILEWDSIQQQLSKLWAVPSLSTEVERRGGSGLNASTSKDLTRYFVSLPVNAMEFWFWLESERLFSPVMRQFYRERDVVLEERKMRSEDSPTGKLWEALMLESFAVHPNRHPVIGYQEEIRQLLADETLEFHKRYYVPANMVVTIVGNVDVEEVFEHARRYFGRIPRSELPTRDFPEEPAWIGQRTVNVFFDSEPHVAVAYRIPSYPHPDKAAIDVLMKLLLGNRLTPMHRELVEKLQVAQSVDVFDGPGETDPLAQVFWMTPREPHSPTKLISEFDRVLSAATFTEEELQVARRSIQVSYLESLNSNYSIGMALASSQIFHGDWRHVLKYYDALQAVSLDDVHRVLDTYFRDAGRIIGVVGREKAFLK